MVFVTFSHHDTKEEAEKKLSMMKKDKGAIGRMSNKIRIVRKRKGRNKGRYAIVYVE